MLYAIASLTHNPYNATLITIGMSLRNKQTIDNRPVRLQSSISSLGGDWSFFVFNSMLHALSLEPYAFNKESMS